MKKYASDARCLDYLSSFKSEVQQQLADYHTAVVEQIRQRLVERMTNKLMAIQQEEKAINDSLQEVIVREIVESFQRKFAAEPKQQEAALKAALQSIAGDDPSMDPVRAHFASSLKELKGADFARSPANGNGTVLERVTTVFQGREKEFLESFTISPEEASEVKQIVQKCKSGKDFDFSKLSEQDSIRLDSLQEAILNRVGYATVTEADIKPLEAVASTGAPLVEHVNTQLALAKAKIRAARLTAFARSFA